MRHASSTRLLWPFGSPLWLLLLVGIAMASTAVLAQQDEAAGARGAAQTFAKRVITPALKNPAAADFSWESVTVDWTKTTKDGTTDEPYQLVQVSGVVRSTNSFNAVVPQKYRVIMTHKKDVWEPAIVALEGEVLFVNSTGKSLLEKSRDLIEQKRQQQREEDEQRRREEQRRKERLKQAGDAGQTAADEAITRNKWNSKVADNNVAKAAKKAVEGSDFAQDDEEKARFVEAFLEYVKTAKARSAK